MTRSGDDIVQTWKLMDEGAFALHRHHALADFSDSSAPIRAREMIYMDGAGSLDASTECYGRYR